MSPESNEKGDPGHFVFGFVPRAGHISFVFRFRVGALGKRSKSRCSRERGYQISTRRNPKDICGKVLDVSTFQRTSRFPMGVAVKKKAPILFLSGGICLFVLTSGYRFGSFTKLILIIIPML